MILRVSTPLSFQSYGLSSDSITSTALHLDYARGLLLGSCFLHTSLGDTKLK